MPEALTVNVKVDIEVLPSALECAEILMSVSQASMIAQTKESVLTLSVATLVMLKTSVLLELILAQKMLLAVIR